jgi:hypothetical protein
MRAFCVYYSTYHLIHLRAQYVPLHYIEEEDDI